MSYNLLKGKRGIIFGALNQQSIAWKVAERAHEEGAEFVLTNAPIALRMGELNTLAEKTGSQVIAADATSIDDLTNLVETWHNVGDYYERERLCFGKEHKPCGRECAR